MRILVNALIGFVLTIPVLAHAQDAHNREDKAKEEIQRLFSDLNAAITKKDRARLEQLFADEFQFIRPSGAVATKAVHIKAIMANDPISSTPVPPPSADQLMMYGNTAVSRNTIRNTAVTSIFVKKNGQWQFLQAQGTRLAPERLPIVIDPKLLDSFVGKYDFGPNAIATVTREGDTLRWRGGVRMTVTLVPLSETVFFAKESETELMFVKDEKGKITGVVLRLGSCQDSKAAKIE